jgi:hypothetical protein
VERALTAVLFVAAIVLGLSSTEGRCCPAPEAFKAGRPVNLPQGCPAPMAGVWRSVQAHRTREGNVASVVAERDRLRVELAAMESRYIEARRSTAQLMLDLARRLELCKTALAVEPCVCPSALPTGAVSCAACGLGAGLMGALLAD